MEGFQSFSLFLCWIQASYSPFKPFPFLQGQVQKRRHCTSKLQIARCKLQNAPGYSSRRGLPSLARTKRPPSPLEIWRSSSRQVMRSQVLARLPGMGTLSGGWPEMVLPIFAAASCRGPRDCWMGDRLIFCPKRSTFSGSSTLEFICGGCSTPSLNST